MENVIKIADVVFKGIAAVAGLIIVLIAQNFQASMTAATLQNQREQADSSLRATMFSNLINPVVGDRKGNLDVDLERLLVELLALNFHEHFALSPLMVRVDERLARDTQKEEAEKSRARESLRYVASLVAQRQLALLTKKTEDSRPGAQTKDQTCIYRIKLAIAGDEKKKPSPETLEASIKKSPSQSRPCSSTITSFFDELIGITSPNGIYSLLFTVRPENWNDQSFRVSIQIDSEKATKQATDKQPAPPAVVPVVVDFVLTWFDFPFIDNTLLADGTRFSLVLDQVQVGEEKREAVLKLIWFPKDYFSLRERPINYSEFRSRLGFLR